MTTTNFFHATVPVRLHGKVSVSLTVINWPSIAALSRPHDDSMPAEDVDAIQLELELLLSTVSQRARALKTEYEALDREDKRDRKGKYIEKQPSSPSTKRKRDEKKFKDGAKYFGSQAKVARVKNASSHSRVVAQHTDDSMDSVPYFPTNYALRENPKLVMPKNDTPNKFWLSVEPYCMPISHEDIKVGASLMLFDADFGIEFSCFGFSAPR